MRIYLTWNQTVAYRMVRLDELLGQDVDCLGGKYILDAPLTKAQVHAAIHALRRHMPEHGRRCLPYLGLARKLVEGAKA